MCIPDTKSTVSLKVPAFLLPFLQQNCSNRCLEQIFLTGDKEFGEDEAWQKRAARFKCCETVEKYLLALVMNVWREGANKQPYLHDKTVSTGAEPTVSSATVLSGLWAVSSSPVLFQAELRLDRRHRADSAASQQQLNTLQCCLSLRGSWSIAREDEITGTSAVQSHWWPGSKRLLSK